MTRSITSFLSKLVHGPRTEMDYQDVYLAVLRCVFIVGGFAWLAVAGPELPNFDALIPAVIAFSLYSVAVYGALWLFSLPIRRVYLVTMLLDLAFVYWLCTETGGLQSVFIPAFYVLAGVQAYHFGLRKGLLLALVIAAAYILIDPAGMAAEFRAHYAIEVAFLGLAAVSFGILSDRVKEDGRIRGELTAKIADFHRMLVKSERGASLGRATALAHNISNPVAVILSRLDCMCEDLGAAGTVSSMAEDIEVLRRHALKISETTNRLLGYARTLGSGPAEVDVNGVMEECVALVQPKIESKGVNLNINLSNGLPRVWGFSARLEEAVVNILNNAIDALDTGGQISLNTALHADSPGEIQIIVADSGKGIPPEDLPKIFDPFYTTKEVDQGNGIGLYIVQQIVEDHSGKMDIQSDLGKGTTVTLTFPVRSSMLEAAFSG
jgi:signal transduction histidine kinase